MPTLKMIVEDLKLAVTTDTLTREVVEQATGDLRDIGYCYDNVKYPPITDAAIFVDTSGDGPSNLAETLLWKLGKWTAYKNFATRFADPNVDMTNQDVVFSAFANHLRDRHNPIYDQHALRALWAIGGAVSATEISTCKSVLVNGNDRWKDSGSGPRAVNGYRLFVRKIGDWTNAADGPTRTDLDRLMMPLGQSLKSNSPGGYHDFRAICGWPRDPVIRPH